MFWYGFFVGFSIGLGILVGLIVWAGRDTGQHGDNAWLKDNWEKQLISHHNRDYALEKISTYLESIADNIIIQKTPISCLKEKNKLCAKKNTAVSKRKSANS